MEFFGFIFLFVFLLAAAIVCGVVADRYYANDSNQSHGLRKGFATLAPFLLVIYCLIIGYLRNSYHRSHAEAYSSDGRFCIPLNHGYDLSFFDEMPEDSNLSMGTGMRSSTSISTKIDQIQQQESIVGGHIHDGETTEEINNPYFALDTSSGTLRRFPSEDQMRRSYPGIGALQSSDNFYNSISSTQRSSLFWPLMLAGPSLISWRVLRVTKQKPAH